MFSKSAVILMSTNSRKIFLILFQDSWVEFLKKHTVKCKSTNFREENYSDADSTVSPDKKCLWECMVNHCCESTAIYFLVPEMFRVNL